jgi:Uma2 family endonuclease
VCAANTAAVLGPNRRRLDRWRALSEAEREGFPPLCPDLVVELASPSDLL